MKLSIRIFTVLFFLLVGKSQAQVSLDFSGYVTSLQSAQMAEFEEGWVTDNLIHNRLNFKLYMGSHVTWNAEFRNRLIWGKSTEMIPNYAEYIGGENGWLNLSHVWVDGESSLLHSKVDRLSLELNFDKLNITLGRQRINWSRTYVWNTNDIFNSYSFFDVDYIERPGSDAVRLQYYIGMASKIELAAKADYYGKVTAAAYTMINAKGYDIQFLAGIIDEREWTFGCGWAGDLWKFGFKGEVNYLMPREEFQNELDNALLVSAGLEYMFPNQLMLRSEYLFNQAVPEIADMSELLLSTQSVRNLSFSKNSLFVGADYPITPLLKASLSGMWMPELEGFFAGPNLAYSLKDNFDISLIGQYFNMKLAGERMAATQAYLKFMWSF